MRKTVRRRHNKDGSVTTTTSYSRKNIFGTRVVDTYVSKTPTPSKKKKTVQAVDQYSQKVHPFSVYCFLLSFIFNIAIPLYKLTSSNDSFSIFAFKLMKNYGGIFIFFFSHLLVGVLFQIKYSQLRRSWLEKNDNAEQKTAFAEKEPRLTNDTINFTNNIDEIIKKAEKEGEEIAKQIELDNERRKAAAAILNENTVATKETTLKSATVVTTQKKFDDSTIEQLKKRYIAFDVETTGLNSYTERIIEVGAVVFENMIPVKEYGSLVNAQKTISAQTTAINHITNEMIRNAPSEEQVYTELVNFLGDSLNAQTIICAHNADFDIGFLSKTLRRLGFNAEINYVDTLSAAQRLAPESPDHKLSTLANHFRILVEQDHEAVSDARVCGEILAKLIALEQEEKERRLIQEEEKRQQEELMQKMLIEYSDKRNQVSINPVHNRVPLDSIERLKKSDIEQENGQKFWENGDVLRKGGNIETAIEFFDKARHSGYCSPELYQSYAKAYRQLKDYDNEIDILDEAIYRFKNDRDVWEKFQTRRYKAVCLLIKRNEKTDKAEDEKDLINV